MRRVLPRLYLGAVFVSLLGCSFGETPASESTPWYNSSVFRPILGDFEQVEAINLIDPQEVKTLYTRGSYLVQLAACGSCHGQNPDQPNAPLAGGRVLTDSLGEVVAANITPHRESGIGAWNLNEISRAIRASIDRGGKPLSVDLHAGFRWMSDQDVKAVGVYIMSQPAVANVVERREIGGFSRRKWGVVSRHQDFGGYVPAQAERLTPQYGRYLASNVLGCARCHSPGYGTGDPGELFSGGSRGSKGLTASLGKLVAGLTPGAGQTAQARTEIRGLLSDDGKKEYDQRYPQNDVSAVDRTTENVRSIFLSLGSEPQGVYPPLGPDIRGSSADGLQGWSVEQIDAYLAGGRKPDGRQTDFKVCPWNYYSVLTERDRRAVSMFLKSL